MKRPGLKRMTGLEQFAVAASVICILASLALTQINPSAQKPKRSVYAALADAPETARARKNPFEGNERDAAAGGKLFEEHCSECHGAKAGGTRRGPSLLRDEVQQASPGTLFWTLTNGVVWHGMPVWSKLPEPERWQIVTFLDSLHSQEAKPGTPRTATNR
ncbi:MAG: cytochrome c [Terriglobales bacterium]